MPAPRIALILGTALLSTPAFAQEIEPPPVVTTQSTPAPAATAPAATPQATTRFAPPTPVVQSVPVTEPEPQTATALAPKTPAPAARTPARTVSRSTTPAPRAATPAPAPAEPTAVAPELVAADETAIDTPPVETAAIPVPAPEPVETVATPEPARQGTPLWPWLLGGLLLIVGIVAAMLLGRRRTVDEEVYEEPVYEAPVARAPVANTPVAQIPEPASEPVTPFIAADATGERELAFDSDPEPTGPIATDAHASSADAEDLAGVADRTAPVSQRPWLEFGMRPLRAGTSADEALVEIELIVGNSGDTAAKDVRISAFMLPEGTSDMEAMLIERADASSVPPVTIAPGEGTRVDATLAMRKADLDARFSPVVVADARYRMADGSEGRTSASFRVGIDQDGKVAPIEIGRPAMHDNVAAALHGTPEHA